MATIRDMEIDELVTGYACSLDGCTYEYRYFFDSREQAENACRKAFAGDKHSFYNAFGYEPKDIPKNTFNGYYVAKVKYYMYDFKNEFIEQINTDYKKETGDTRNWYDDMNRFHIEILIEKLNETLHDWCWRYDKFPKKNRFMDNKFYKCEFKGF